MQNNQAVDYERKLNRAKEIIGVSSDKDFAELIGINPKTFSRKRKQLYFPETELRAFSSKQNITVDWDYIYTGISSKDFANSDREGGIPAFATAFLEPDTLSEEEKHLIRLFRVMGGRAKDSLLMCAEGMAYKHTDSPYAGVLDNVKQAAGRIPRTIEKNE
ncbi:hypothetical protein [Neisseria weaveri]|uniref:hypothetical protein n=1 Tax=Neisseria weaveri TaxID=28091 RepID=UPI0007C9B26B|nr:hypothetical protein [Neisseria weaveri]SAY50909.1 transcriptional regulator [Neisseria weaveri]